MLSYDSNLPIVAHRREILAHLAAHPALIVCGETGSGKSTQLPKFCLDAGRGQSGMIGHTQPRRLAARSIARRLRDELGPEHSHWVAWKVRFDDATGPRTRIKSMTDGILLAELSHDRHLRAYDTIILDEAHERSLNVDFLLGVLKHLLTRRDDLRVIVTSATIDPDRFARHFDDAPVVEVSGRTYPVDVRYAPLDRDEAELESALAQALQDLQREGPGDTLVFLPTARDIRDLSSWLSEHAQLPMDILPLYGRLSAKAQDRVFRPGRRPRVILSTNVAETSLTVPGVRYVVDTGTVRMSRFSVRHRVQRLPIEPISQASAAQRAGRCGRTQDGICIRLYEESDLLRRDAHTAPEILRTNLASVILRMKAFDLGEPETFPFLDRPPPSRIRAARQALFDLQALDEHGALTPLGRALARLPVDPRFGRMALAARDNGCLDDVLVIVAALSVQDPRERPTEARDDADRVHARLQDPRSDFLGLLRLWAAYETESTNRSRRKLAAWCRDHYLRPTRMREWGDVLSQLRDAFPHRRDAPRKTQLRGSREDAIHRSLLAGLIDHVACRGSGHAYAGTQGTQVYLFPGSVLFQRKPKWIVSAERVETSRLFARTVAPVRRTWIEPLAKHLVKRTYRDAHFDPRQRHVAAFERVTLRGLVLVARRRVHYGPIHPARAREIFLRHALVHGKGRSRAAFQRHNSALLGRARDVAARLRRRDVVADADDLYAFFDARVPAGIYCAQTFRRWWRPLAATSPRLLHLSWRDAAPGAPPGGPEAILTGYPDRVTWAGHTLPLRYRFDPGHPADGVSVTVPVRALPNISAARLTWLVPGMLAEKIAALLRTLPKSLRRRVQPMGLTATTCASTLTFGQGSLEDALVAWLEHTHGLRLLASDFRPARLDAHHHMHLRVTDESGKPMANGRSLARLRQQVMTLCLPDAPADEPTQQPGATSWVFDTLPSSEALVHGGFTVPAYPCLEDRGNGVIRSVRETKAQAARSHRAGLVRLAALQLDRLLRRALERMGGWKARTEQFRTLGSAATLRRQLQDRIAEVACGLRGDERDAAAFAAAVARGERTVSQVADQVRQRFDDVLSLYDRVAHKLMLDPPPAWKAPIQDMTQQMARLVESDFLVTLPYDRLAHVARYVRGMDLRLQKLGYGALANDLRHMATIAPHWERYLRIEARNHLENRDDPALDTLRWMIEELRVSLFAQELGTDGPISAARLDAQWQAVRDPAAHA